MLLSGEKTDLDIRAKMVMPSLSALLPNPSDEHPRYVRPLLVAVCLHQIDQEPSGTSQTRMVDTKVSPSIDRPHIERETVRAKPKAIESSGENSQRLRTGMRGREVKLMLNWSSSAVHCPLTTKGGALGLGFWPSPTIKEDIPLSRRSLPPSISPIVDKRE